MVKIKFTEEEFNNIKKLRSTFEKAGLYLVLDGLVTQDDHIWWHSADGPTETTAKFDHYNVLEFPEYYSIEKPNGESKFVYDSMFEEE